MILKDIAAESVTLCSDRNLFPLPYGERGWCDGLYRIWIFKIKKPHPKNKQVINLYFKGRLKPIFQTTSRKDYLSNTRN